MKVPASVSREDDTHGGWIEFGKSYEYPRRKTTSPTRAVLPEEGMAVLFPSFFYHRTVPLAGTERRISLAFDVLPED